MIFLSLGSNLPSNFGNKFENLKLALSLISSCGILIYKKSSFYETPSYPNKNNPKFINIVISISTDLSPKDLMSVLIYIEKKLGRKRNKKNDPRTCDIDIIDYNGHTYNIKFENFNLLIPHKKLESRNFVLYPLQEVYPKWIHPKTKETISSLINKLPSEDRKSIFKVKEN